MNCINLPTQEFIRTHANDDVNALLLRKNIPAGVDLKLAIQQIEGRQKAQEKLPSLASNVDFIFPPKLSMEQCSSEPTAQYKSQLFSGKTLVDITGGLGIDSYYISRCATNVVYVEKNADLCAVAQQNFEALGAKNISTHCDEGINFLRNATQHFDAIYLDPARRDANKNKVVSLVDCEPNILEHLDFLFEKGDLVVLKASPMLDITQALRELQCVCEVHVVAVKNECKELLFVCRKEGAQPKITCVNMRPNASAVGYHAEPVEACGEEFFKHATPRSFDRLRMTTREVLQVFDFTLEEESSAIAQYAYYPKRYLYEPNVAVLKAGAFKLLCARFGVEKLHPDTHLYTSDILIPNFPGRAFEVQQTLALSEKEFKNNLPEMQANIAVRNFPLRVADIRKKYKIKEGGNVFLFAVTLKNGERRVVKTRKV